MKEIGIPVATPVGLERTIMGIAHLAGVHVGFWKLEDIHNRWQLKSMFEPEISTEQRERLYAEWSKPVASARSFAPTPITTSRGLGSSRRHPRGGHPGLQSPS